MDLPINNKELGTIVSALHLGGDTALYQKLKLVKETIDENNLVAHIRKYFVNLMGW